MEEAGGAWAPPAHRGSCSHPVQAEHAALVQVEVSLDALGLVVRILLEALTHTF